MDFVNAIKLVVKIAMLVIIVALVVASLQPISALGFGSNAGMRLAPLDWYGSEVSWSWVYLLRDCFGSVLPGGVATFGVFVAGFQAVSALMAALLVYRWIRQVAS